jgi:hypothetical protein
MIHPCFRSELHSSKDVFHDENSNGKLDTNFLELRAKVLSSQPCHANQNRQA